MRDRGLQRNQLIVERQEGVATERYNHRFLLSPTNGGMDGLRPHRGIGGMRPLGPLLHCRRTDPMAPGERPYALFTSLYRSTDCLSRRGAAV